MSEPKEPLLTDEVLRGLETLAGLAESVSLDDILDQGQRTPAEEQKHSDMLQALNWIEAARKRHETASEPSLRVKLGYNIYSNEMTCARCRRRFVGEGVYLRLEQKGKTVDIPVCGDCLDRYRLVEGMIDFKEDNPSFPIGIA